MKKKIPKIAFTAGEPAGIGIEILLKIAQQTLPCQLIAFADIDLIHQQAAYFNLKLDIQAWTEDIEYQDHVLYVKDIKLNTPSKFGVLNAKNSQYVLNTIATATTYCQQGKMDAIVTAPIHKGIINEAGIDFTGHTEYLAELTGGTPVMMLACDELRVALATTHLAVNKISEAITAESLKTVIKILDHDLKIKFKIKKPKIGVCGLNPHAGEDGHLGHEEIDFINPLLAELNQQGMDLTGTLPADTIFTPNNMKRFDAILAMYHDQGLPVLKHVCFGKAVNLTLGLPIIRTSVDHGTALDIAGKNQATISSALTAIEYAVDMC